MAASNPFSMVDIIFKPENKTNFEDFKTTMILKGNSIFGIVHSLKQLHATVALSNVVST